MTKIKLRRHRFGAWLLLSILFWTICLIDGFSATRPSPLQRIPLVGPGLYTNIGRRGDQQQKQQWLDTPFIAAAATSTQLRSIAVVGPSAIAASLVLLGSSVAGVQFDRRLPSSGILGTLMTAALLSNVLPMVPRQHLLYDLCWSWILPGSLALLLLGYRVGDATIQTQATGKVDISQQKAMIKAIGRVAGPFLLASMGSIFGCWASYQFAIMGSWFSTTAQARAATSCLAASYVGGSVNLFATAKIIQAPPSLLSSMATADLIAMALYFSALSSTMEWNWLKSLFYRDGEDDKDPNLSEIEMSTMPRVDNPKESSSPASPWSQGKARTLSTVPILLGLTWSIVAMANKVESFVGRWVPGTACGVIAVMAPLLRSIVFRIKWVQDRSQEWSWTASSLADWFFFLFFAAIGVGVDLQASLQMGPACLLVSILALAVHLLVTVIGSHLCLPTKRWGIALEDLWIASNAAIGGPATAAAFCNRMKGDGKNASILWGRTVAATVWGVVGYAIGTTVGMGLFRFLAPPPGL